MRLSRIKKKLFLDEAYGVAIRSCKSQNSAFYAKYPTFSDWYADPFVCTHEGRSWVFVELMNSYHILGQIAVAPIVGEQIGAFKIIISEPFHMSFPNVFSWGGHWYMVPETYMARELRLYSCRNFPYEWALETVLLRDEELVDSALFPYENGFLILSHDIRNRENSANRVFSLDMRTKTAKEVKPAGNWRKERPGGTFWQENGAWYHALQDCENCYGDYLHICRVHHFSDSEFMEEEVKTIYVNDIEIVPWKHCPEHTHTYNTDGVYEVYDFRYDKVYWDKFFVHQWKEIKKKIGNR